MKICQDWDHKNVYRAEIKALNALASLQRENLFTLPLDYGSSDVFSWIVFEAAQNDLFTFCEEKFFDETTAKPVFQHIATAVQALHSRGFAHQDIKPENILVWLDDAGNIVSVKLCDFSTLKTDNNSQVSKTLSMYIAHSHSHF